ncbi:MAG: hypothetical protein ACPG49_10540 [Chitinophagales bacterium]
MNYFKPAKGKIYGLSFTATPTTGYVGYLGVRTDLSTDDNIRGEGSKDMTNYRSFWQFMPVGTNTFIIVNQQTGGVLTVEDNGSGNLYCTSKALDDNTPTIIGIQSNNVSYLYAFYIPSYDAYIYPVYDGAGTYHTSVEVKDSADDAAVWHLEDTSSDSYWTDNFPALANPNYALPDLPAVASANKPAFDSEGNAPMITAMSLGKSTYIPFCLITDSSMSDSSKAITESPYYLLQQYEQYYQASCVENETAGTITLVDTWEYGSSESKSRNFTQEFGIKVGFNMTENEFIAKENESITASVDLGFQEGNTSTSSETMSKEVRVEVLPNNKLALYGITTSYKLFRLSDATNVANQQNPTAVSQMDDYAKMANKFLTITYPLGS